MELIYKEKICDLILGCIKEVEENNNWEPFVDCVLCSQIHDGQREWLTLSIAKENLLHPGNGWGKSQVIAIKHIYKILKHYSAGVRYKTLHVAITNDQAEIVQDRIIEYIKNSPVLSFYLIGTNSVTKHPFPKIHYGNGAITEFKTTKKKGESIEGKEYGYISADEVALEMHLEFIRDKILLPRLRSWKDSQIDFSATPKGYNAFWRIAEHIKQKGGYVRGGSSFENPWIDHGLLNYLIGSWSQAKVDQTIYGKFIDTATMMFSSRIANFFDSNLAFEEVETGHKYVEAWDLARGRKGSLSDQTVGFRIDVTARPHRIVKRWAFQLPWTEKERELINAEAHCEIEHSSIEREIRTAQYESDAKVLLDSTGVGDTLYGMVMDIAEPIDFRGGNKDKLLDHAQAVIDADLLKSPFIPELADEMTIYQRDDRNLDTDNVMAMVIGCQAIEVRTAADFGTVDD